MIAIRQKLTPLRKGIVDELGLFAHRYLAVRGGIWAFVLVCCLLLLPAVFSSIGSASDLLWSGRIDEPVLTQCLESMTHFPWGRAANYWRHADWVPQHWSYFMYGFTSYCGNFQHTLAFFPFATAKLLGAPTFPIAPALLRLISALSALGLVVCIYNYARQHSGAVAAPVAAALVLTLSQFTKLGAGVHPDILMAFMDACALVFALSYVNTQSMSALALLGLAMGGAHGAKMGGPPLVPLAAVALVWGGYRLSGGWSVEMRRVVLRNGVALSAAGTAGFFIAVPHALIWPDYWQTLLGLIKTYRIANYTLVDWLIAIWAEQGPYVCVPYLIGLGLVGYDILRRRARPALVLAAVLSVTSMLWYAAISTIAISTYYLIISYAAGYILVGDVVQRLFMRISGFFQRPLRPLAATVAIGLSMLVAGTRGPELLHNTLLMVFSYSPTPVSTGIIAPFVRPDQRIMTDLSGVPYFDTSIYPDQVLIGTLKYTDLWRYRPDYFVLSMNLAESKMYKDLRASQQMPMSDGYIFNLRLYQDLLDRSGAPFKLGATAVPGVEVVTTLAYLPKKAKTGTCGWQGVGALPVFGALQSRMCAYFASFQSENDIPTPEQLSSMTPTAVLYRYVQPGTPSGAPGPISSGEQPPYLTALAFDQLPGSWASNHVGPQVAGNAFIGFDYGAGRQGRVESVRLVWRDAATVPTSILVQYRDTGGQWITAERFDTKAGNVEIVADKDQYAKLFHLAAPSYHRQWRILADAGLQGTMPFMLEELEFWPKP